MMFWTVVAVVLAIAVPWAMYEIAEVIYGLGLEHGLTRHTEARIRERLTCAGIDVEFERDRIARQQERKRPALTFNGVSDNVARWPGPPARRPF